jgi:hypothetical protein
VSPQVPYILAYMYYVYEPLVYGYKIETSSVVSRARAICIIYYVFLSR